MQVFVGQDERGRLEVLWMGKDGEKCVEEGTLVSVKLDDFHTIVGIVTEVGERGISMCVSTSDKILVFPFSEIEDMEPLVDRNTMVMADAALFRLASICKEQHIDTPFWKASE